MKDLLLLATNDPKNGMVLGALLLCAFLIKYVASRIQKDFNRMENTLARWEVDVARNMSLTQEALARHSGDMGKATKAINGDMLKIKENLFELKQELLGKIEALRELASYLEREFQKTAQTMRLTTDNFEDKFGRVIQIKAQLDEAYGKIVRLEASDQRNQENLGKVAKTLVNHKEALERLSKK